MSVTDEQAVPAIEESEQSATEEVEYPSACFLLESCFQDYQRLQENYNKIYEKINVALAFTGVILTIMLSSFDFSPAMINVEEMKVSLKFVKSHQKCPEIL